MAKSKKDNPIRAALLQSGNVKRGGNDTGSSSVELGRSSNKEDSKKLAILSRQQEFRRQLRADAIDSPTLVK